MVRFGARMGQILHTTFNLFSLVSVLITGKPLNRCRYNASDIPGMHKARDSTVRVLAQVVVLIILLPH